MPVTKQNSSLSGERILGRSFMGRRRNFWIISEARREREKKKKEEQLMKLPSIGAVQELVQRRM